MTLPGSPLILVVTGPPIITSERKIWWCAEGKTEQPMKRTPAQTAKLMQVEKQSKDYDLMIARPVSAMFRVLFLCDLSAVLRGHRTVHTHSLCE